MQRLSSIVQAASQGGLNILYWQSSGLTPTFWAFRLYASQVPAAQRKQPLALPQVRLYHSYQEQQFGSGWYRHGCA